jgi:hypothetical protein
MDGLQNLPENREETADLSTTLRSGRDDKFVLGKLTIFRATQAASGSTNLSSRPERSVAERSAVSS